MEPLVLANTIIVLSAAIATLALIDLLMTDRQKDTLSNKVLALWSWLDDLRKLSFIDWIRNHRGLVSLFATILPLATLLFATLNEILRFGYHHLSLISGSFGAIVGLLIGLWLVSFVLRAKPGRQILVRATGALLLAVLPLAVLRPFEIFFGDPLLDALFDALPERHAVTVFEAVMGAVLAGKLVTLILLAIWLLVVCPLVFAYVATALLYASEQLVRRIAEYRKGPVLALSALCGGIAALLKVFGE